MEQRVAAPSSFTSTPLLDETHGLQRALARYMPGFLNQAEQESLFSELAALETTVFSQDVVTMFGVAKLAPRLTATFSTEGATVYRYGGVTRQAVTDWPPLLRECMERARAACGGFEFNFAFVNIYRDGSDSISWHADDEPAIWTDEHTNATTIASVSLGCERTFQLRRVYSSKRGESPTPIHQRVLESGSLCTMEHQTQQHWKHCVPKTKKRPNAEAWHRGVRINITFRRMKV